MHNEKNNFILILGASGYIGNYLFNRFKQEHFNVIGTYFKNKKPGLLKFSLENTKLEDLKLAQNRITHMIIAAASNVKIDESKIYWDYSYKTNVIEIKRIIDFCFDHNIIPIYISSDGIFDGKKGNYCEEDKANPINCYGRMKYEVEKHILKSKKKFMILRMGRVFGIELEDDTLLTRTLKEMEQGKELFYITDMKFTPVYINDVFVFVKFLIEKKMAGIFHIASLKSTSRYKIAQTIKETFKLKISELNPCKVKSLNYFDKRPKDTTLNITKYKKLTGYKVKPLKYYLNLISQNSP